MNNSAKLALVLLVTTVLMLTFHLGRKFGNHEGFDRGWDKGYIRGLENPQNSEELRLLGDELDNVERRLHIDKEEVQP